MKKILAVMASAAALAAVAPAQNLAFDSLTGSTAFTTTGGVPRHLMGMAFSLGNTPSGPITITGMDLSFAAVTAQVYNNIQLDIAFFDLAANTTTGATPAFSTLLASYTLSTGAFTTAASTVYTFQNQTTPGASAGISFGATPFTFSGSNNLGIQVLIRGDIGAGLVNSDNLTLPLRTGGPIALGTPTAGTAGQFGFYRNASQTAPTNANTPLLGSDFRTFTGSTNIAIPMRLYSPQAVPEPGTMAALGLGALALMRRRRKA
jgi:hypothetical protein